MCLFRCQPTAHYGKLVCEQTFTAKNALLLVFMIRFAFCMFLLIAWDWDRCHLFQRELLVTVFIMLFIRSATSARVDPLFPEKIIYRKVPCNYWSKTFLEILHAVYTPTHFPKKLGRFFSIWRCYIFAAPPKYFFLIFWRCCN